MGKKKSRKALRREQEEEEILEEEFAAARNQEREHRHRRRFTSMVLAVLVLAMTGLLGYMALNGVMEETQKFEEEAKAEYVLKAEIVDEAGGNQISSRVKEYIETLEQDLRDEGYTMTRATLPAEASRAIYVDIEEREEYFKVSLDRDTGVTAEDIGRMVKYLEEKELQVQYVDVRIEGKAYYM